MNSLKKYEENENVDKLNLFYVPVSKETYPAVEDFARKIGVKRQGMIRFGYGYVLFNITNEKSEDLNAKSYFSTPRDKRDNFPVIEIEDLNGLVSVINLENNVEAALKASSLFEDTSNKGVKLSQEKAPMGKLLRQFPLALEAVAFRSKFGHEKYIETDKDWLNFKRVPDAIEEYEDAIVRHLAEIGDEEDSLGHLAAAAWNILAKLQLKLENND